MFDVEKINSLSGCGECVFCLAKCPKCSTADVKIEYHRRYSKDGDVNSAALIACECGKIVFKEQIIDGVKDLDGKPVTFQDYNQKLYEVPKLTEIFDEYFMENKPKDSVDVNIIYELKNDTEDELTLQFEDMDKNIEFEEELPDFINYKITGQKGKASEIEVSVYRIHTQDYEKINQ